jgi:glycosyltransferase involved in cell wall biosynthesis
MKRRLGFLSGGPLISTRPDAKTIAARAHILGLIRAFERLGWEVEPFIVGDRVPRRLVTVSPKQSTMRRFLLALAADLILPVLGVTNAQRAWRELGERVDCVYERYYPFNAMGWAFKRRGVPWILETNVPFFYEAQANKTNVMLSGLAGRLEIATYKKCDVLVCVSETLKEIVVRKAGIPSEKIVVIPNGVDTTVFNPETCEPKRIFDEFTVGYVGGVHPRQGLEPLIEALSELRAEGSEISLVVVGGGIMQAACEALARQLGVLEHVAFVGRVRWQEVPRFIAGFDLAYSGQVRMYEREMYNSPLKLYEYMAMAKPVVASDFEDARRVVRNEETGFLFQPGNKEDLERALRRAYELRDELPRMGAKAREEVVSAHDWLVRVRDIISAVENRVQSS